MMKIELEKVYLFERKIVLAGSISARGNYYEINHSFSLQCFVRQKQTHFSPINTT